MELTRWEIASDCAQVAGGLGTIAAIFLAPWLTLKLQRERDKATRRVDRRQQVFETLMVNRATPLSPEFVRALNSIDLTFDEDDQNDRAVRNSWKTLLDHFSNGVKDETFPKLSLDLTVKLLSSMGSALGRSDLDEVYLKRHSYYPLALSNVEEEQQELRRLLIQLLSDKRRLPVAIFEDGFPELLKSTASSSS